MIRNKNKTCIIGACPAGLAFARTLKLNNVDYEQFEATEDVGGNWKHGVYDTAHIISSKSVTEFKSYPMPDDYPDFPSKNQMCSYLQSYAKHYELYKFIEFNTKVVYCRPIKNNFWEITLSTGEQRIYENVIICNGHHWAKRFPQFEGTFTGEYIHSKDFKNPEQFKDKRVLTIGGGNSACDVASEAARVGHCSDLSMRSGVWFLPKTIMGKPLSDIEKPYTPLWLQRFLLKLVVRMAYGDYHKDYNLPRPKDKIFDKHPTLSTEVFHYIKHGRIKVKPNIKRFEGNIVEFEDGTRQEYDMVVAATGFYLSFPFLSKEIVENRKDQLIDTYGMSMHLNWRGLYTPSVYQVRGGVGTMYEPEAEYTVEMMQIQKSFTIPVANALEVLGFRPFGKNVLGYNDVNGLMRSVLKKKKDIIAVLKMLEKGHSPFQNVVKSALTMEEEKQFNELTIN
jgi:hypothetical protein